MADGNPTSEQQLEDEVRKRTKELEFECSQKTRELQDSQTRLLRAEKMVALGNLVAGLAHEINTPLGAVTNNNEVFELAFQKVMELIKLGRSPDAEVSEISELLTIVEDSIRTNRLACERLVRIVRSVRTFARLDEAEWKKADIHEGIESTLTLLAHELRGRITIVKEFGDLKPLECYPNQLNQVFMNILMNAAQAITGQGEIRIATAVENGSVVITISDNGPGILPENVARIFDPGFTTKNSDLGTGLGLAISARIIENHNGRIEVESQPGSGSRFRIFLPILQAEPGKSNGE